MGRNRKSKRKEEKSRAEQSLGDTWGLYPWGLSLMGGGWSECVGVREESQIELSLGCGYALCEAWPSQPSPPRRACFCQQQHQRRRKERTTRWQLLISGRCCGKRVNGARRGMMDYF